MDFFESIPTPTSCARPATEAALTDYLRVLATRRRLLIAAAIFIGYFVVNQAAASLHLHGSASRTCPSLAEIVVAIAVIGFSIHFGYTGLLNMGKVAS